MTLIAVLQRKESHGAQTFAIVLLYRNLVHRIGHYDPALIVPIRKAAIRRSVESTRSSNGSVSNATAVCNEIFYLAGFVEHAICP